MVCTQQIKVDEVILLKCAESMKNDPDYFSPIWIVKPSTLTECREAAMDAIEPTGEVSLHLSISAKYNGSLGVIRADAVYQKLVKDGSTVICSWSVCPHGGHHD
jgi:hypothetical protein